MVTAAVPDGRSVRDESWLRYVYLAQAVEDHDRRRGPLQRSTELIEEELMDRKNPEPRWTPTEVATYHNRRAIELSSQPH